MSARLTGKVSSDLLKVLLSGQPMKREEIVLALNQSHQLVADKLVFAKDCSHVRQVKHGYYEITELGRHVRTEQPQARNDPSTEGSA